MNCPTCHSETQVIESRHTAAGWVRRRRECASCQYRFTAYETIGALVPTLTKMGEKGFRERLAQLRAIIDEISPQDQDAQSENTFPI